MKCRPGCGACCTAISISSPLPGMPDGKPAGVVCVNLLDDFRCAVHEQPDYPKVCREFKPSPEFCGKNRQEAIENIQKLDELTRP
ncbi:MAG: YkgJ family cysteine cluster protein [Spirochaetia bacterium]